ncbi:MAG TPA: hypothetical protein VFT29_12010 [Gemmatimonadaceae bacterium]|nr:hypothetical protein [Gemmatimonadaceae bacterium]
MMLLYHSRLLEADAIRELGWARRAAGEIDAGRHTLQRALDPFKQLGAQREADELSADLRGEKR